MSLPANPSRHGLKDDPAFNDAAASLVPVAPLQPFSLPAAAFTIFAVFLIRVLASVLPLALMNPLWQLNLASTLVAHGFLPLLGLCLFHIWRVNTQGRQATHRRLIRFSRRLNRLTVLAALGFLLLVPLQVRAAYELISTNFSAITQSSERSIAQQRFDSIEKVIRGAPDAQSMQDHLIILRGPAIPPSDLKQPLPELRAKLLDALNKARQLDREATQDQNAQKSWPMIREVLITSLGALVYAAGFSAFAQSRSAGRGPVESATESDQTLLDDFMEGFAPSLEHRQEEQPAPGLPAPQPLLKPDEQVERDMIP